MPKNKSSPGEKADFFAFPSRFTILGQVRKNTIPIYLPTKRPRIGTIMKNHIQSSSGLSKAALFVCSESDTSLKNCIIKDKKTATHVLTSVTILHIIPLFLRSLDFHLILIHLFICTSLCICNLLIQIFVKLCITCCQSNRHFLFIPVFCKLFFYTDKKLFRFRIIF